jgi:hypothetical protein
MNDSDASLLTGKSSTEPGNTRATISPDQDPGGALLVL